MKGIINFLIVAGLIGTIGPFFGLGLRGMDTAEESMTTRVVLLVFSIDLLIIYKVFHKKEDN